MAKTLRESWITLVNDDRNDSSAGTLNPFIHIARGHHLAVMMLAHGVYEQVPSDIAEHGKRIADEIMMLTQRTNEYAQQKERLHGIPSGIITIADERIKFPSIDNMNEITTLVTFQEIYRQGKAPVGVIRQYLNDQLTVALYGSVKNKYEGQLLAKMTDMWAKIMTGAQVLISNEDQSELNGIMRAWQQDINSRR